MLNICTYKSNLLQSGIQKRLKHTVFQKDTDRGCDCFKTKISHGVDLLNPTLTAETGDKDMHNYIHKYNIWYIYKYVRHGYQPFTDSSDRPSKWCAKFQSCKIRFRERFHVIGRICLKLLLENCSAVLKKLQRRKLVRFVESERNWLTISGFESCSSSNWESKNDWYRSTKVFSTQLWL